MAMFWLAAFLAEMSIYCYFGNNIIYTVKFCRIFEKKNIAKKDIELEHSQIEISTIFCSSMAFRIVFTAVISLRLTKRPAWQC